MNFDLQTLSSFSGWERLAQTGMSFGTNLLAALAIYFIGRWVATRVVTLMKAALTRAKVDKTLVSFLGNVANIGLLILVIIAALGKLGIPTTSVTALIGGAGLAVALSLKDQLSNFAAATAAAEKRTVFHTAAQVCASSKTAQEEPADTALSHTAAKGSRQHSANMANTVAVSHFSQAHIGARGGKGETDLSTATRLLQYAYKPPAAAVTASTSHTNTDARAMSNSYATSR